jgi:hypothetical protein
MIHVYRLFQPHLGGLDSLLVLFAQEPGQFLRDQCVHEITRVD